MSKYAYNFLIELLSWPVPLRIDIADLWVYTPGISEEDRYRMVWNEYVYYWSKHGTSDNDSESWLID